VRCRKGCAHLGQGTAVKVVHYRTGCTNLQRLCTARTVLCCKACAICTGCGLLYWLSTVVQATYLCTGYALLYRIRTVWTGCALLDRPCTSVRAVHWVQVVHWCTGYVVMCRLCTGIQVLHWQAVHYCTGCELLYRLCIAVQAVQCCTSCALLYRLSTDVQAVLCCTGSTLLYRLCTVIQAVHRCTGCALLWELGSTASIIRIYVPAYQIPVATEQNAHWNSCLGNSSHGLQHLIQGEPNMN
jgi:hypothetical protein